MNLKIRKNKKGFTIMEVLFAAFILSVGITATLFLMGKSIGASFASRNEIIASELAQEGIELVRNVRDNNWTHGGNSFDSLPSGDYTVDPSSSNIIGSASNAALSLYRYSGNSFATNAYVTSGNSSSKTVFSRKINISTSGSGSDQTAIVKSFVTWDGTTNFQGACTVANKCVEVVDQLTSWGSN